MNENEAITWDEFLKKSGKSYEEAIEILISYKLIKKSDEDWNMNAYKWGYVFWSEEKKEALITKEGQNYMLECFQKGVDTNAKTLNMRSSKYDFGLKMIEKMRVGAE